MNHTSSPSSSQRIGWIDYAKSIAILIVVVIHTHCQAELTQLLKSFAMPVFFFISGYLFSAERNPRFGDFAYKRFRQLIVPYLWINLVAWVAWVVVLRNYGDDAANPLAWHEPLIGVVFGLPPALVHDIPLWSLLCFFVVEMIYYPVKRHLLRADWFIALVAFVIASAVSLSAPEEGVILPLSLAPAASALFFYAIGHLARTNLGSVIAFLYRTAWLFVVPLALCALFALHLNGPVNFFMGHIGNPVWFAGAALCGIVAVLQLSMLLDRLFGDGRAVRFVSRGTLIICGFHLLAFAAIKAVMLFGFGIEPAQLTAGLIPGLLTAAAGFLLCLPIIWAVERWARPLVNK